INTFCTHVKTRLPKDLCVAVDCHPLYEGPRAAKGRPSDALHRISETFGELDLRLRPVCHLGDPTDEVTRVRDVQRHHGHGVVLRIDIRSLPSNGPTLSRQVRRGVLDLLDLAPGQVDL